MCAKFFCACRLLLGINQYWVGWVYVYVVLCPLAPEGSTSSGSGLKRLRRRGHSLNSHRTDWWSRVSDLRPLGKNSSHIGS